MGPAGRRTEKPSEASDLAFQLERIAKLLSMLAVKGQKQAEQIATLNAVGYSSAEIAERLGTTRNTVSVTLSQQKSEKNNRKTKEK